MLAPSAHFTHTRLTLPTPRHQPAVKTEIKRRKRSPRAVSAALVRAKVVSPPTRRACPLVAQACRRVKAVSSLGQARPRTVRAGTRVCAARVCAELKPRGSSNGLEFAEAPGSLRDHPYISEVRTRRDAPNDSRLVPASRIAPSRSLAMVGVALLPRAYDRTLRGDGGARLACSGQVCSEGVT